MAERKPARIPLSVLARNPVWRASFERSSDDAGDIFAVPRRRLGSRPPELARPSLARTRALDEAEHVPPMRRCHFRAQALPRGSRGRRPAKRDGVAIVFREKFLF